MTVNELIQELQELQPDHGAEQLYAGWPEPLEVSVECHHQYDGSVKVWFKMGYVTVLAARAGKPAALPQPQEQVKCNCRGFDKHAHWCPVAKAALVCTCVEQPEDPCAAHGPKIF